ncbi:MAG: sulfur transferase domain-containing protein [Tistlia sp.]|uniref:beta-lactamase hydrolase domain-containing protein n=1 Tax=Tistlia sp. TaxID=3057121 RepID=UPI0034A1DF75
MEKIARLTPFISVSPQLNETDLGIAAAQGFQSVVCNRPDGESEDQPAGGRIAEAEKKRPA